MQVIGAFLARYVIPAVMQELFKWFTVKYAEWKKSQEIKTDEDRRRTEAEAAAQRHTSSTTADQAGGTFGDMP